MSTDEAGSYYLSAVCPANATNDTWNEAVDSEDLGKIKAAAQESIDAEKTAAKKLEDSNVDWPDEVRESDLAAIAKDYYADISGMQGVLSAKSLDEIDYSFINRETPDAEVQRVRANLGLSSDTEKSCDLD